MLVRCLLAMGLLFCIQLKAQDDTQSLTNDAFPIQILASRSILELLKAFPNENAEFLALLDQSKTINQDDEIWQQIILSATENSILEAILALEKLNKCFVSSANRGNYEILSKDSEKFFNQCSIMPTTIKDVIAKILTIISANGHTNTSYEILLRPSQNHIWAMRLSPKRIKKLYFFTEENLAITIEDWRHVIFLNAN
jgi:hypothetical protein